MSLDGGTFFLELLCIWPRRIERRAFDSSGSPQSSRPAGATHHTLSVALRPFFIGIGVTVVIHGFEWVVERKVSF